jgi:NADH-ubiquinone oxidoreductase chain 1
MSALQRRVGPNVVGAYGTLQPFADALKLILKENLVPQQSNLLLFVLAPIISLVTAIIGWAVIPISGYAVLSSEVSLLYSLAVSGLSVYGILFAGWAANSKYTLLGALRSTAQMISYELILGAGVLGVAALTGTLNLVRIVELQEGIWLLVPLLPLAILFTISIFAETNRTPFDLPEAESELVSGFMTEHSSTPFVFFFLAEYCSIMLISALTSTLFLGGNLISTLFILFLFIWIRATLPRVRYDQLMTGAWTVLIPIVLGLLSVVMALVPLLA